MKAFIRLSKIAIIQSFIFSTLLLSQSGCSFYREFLAEPEQDEKMDDVELRRVPEGNPGGNKGLPSIYIPSHEQGISSSKNSYDSTPSIATPSFAAPLLSKPSFGQNMDSNFPDYPVPGGMNGSFRDADLPNMRTPQNLNMNNGFGAKSNQNGGIWPHNRIEVRFEPHSMEGIIEVDEKELLGNFEPMPLEGVIMVEATSLEVADDDKLINDEIDNSKNKEELKTNDNELSKDGVSFIELKDSETYSLKKNKLVINNSKKLEVINKIGSEILPNKVVNLSQFHDNKNSIFQINNKKSNLKQKQIKTAEKTKLDKLEEIVSKADYAVMKKGVENINTSTEISQLVKETQNEDLLKTTKIISNSKEKFSIEPVIKRKSFLESLPDYAITNIEADFQENSPSQGDAMNAPGIITYVNKPKAPAIVRYNNSGKNNTNNKLPVRMNKFEQNYTITGLQRKSSVDR